MPAHLVHLEPFNSVWCSRKQMPISENMAEVKRQCYLVVGSNGKKYIPTSEVVYRHTLEKFDQQSTGRATVFTTKIRSNAVVGVSTCAVGYRLFAVEPQLGLPLAIFPFTPNVSVYVSSSVMKCLR